MKKADYEEVWEASFLLLCIPMIIEVINYFTNESNIGPIDPVMYSEE